MIKIFSKSVSVFLATLIFCSASYGEESTFEGRWIISLQDKKRVLEGLLEIENIKINTYYLHNQIQDFILNYKSNSKIEILNDGNEILDTGGGILNLINRSDENDFIVLNPDTVWGDNYLKTTINMMDYYFQKKVKNLLMIVNKENSFDERMRGDFSLSNEKLLKNKENNFIYTGLQIINKSLFKNEKVMSFSVTKIWDEAIKNKMLYGFESKEQFIHLTDLEIYNKLVKK